MNLGCRSCHALAVVGALLLAGCSAAAPKPIAPVLSLESCPVTVGTLDAAALAAPHKTLESIVSVGEVVRGRLLSSQCVYENATRKSAYLLAMGRQLKAELSDYLERAEAWQRDYGRLDRRLKDYYKQCLGELLEGSRLQECSAENAALDAERQQLNAAAAPLQQRNQELTDAVTKYRTDLQTSEFDGEQARQDYTTAMQGYARWLAEAYALSASSDVQPYAAKNGCPVVIEPPQGVEAMLPLGEGLLDCFRKLMGLSASAPAIGGG